jgi:homoserine kinase type II
MDPAPEHCRQVGASLARMHLAGKHYQEARPELMHDNLRGLAWWRETLPVLEPLLDPALGELLHDEVSAQTAFSTTDTYSALPRGPVHADLFRNNTLFAGTRNAPVLGGFIDFYFAGVDTWLFDLAVTVNDWCIDFGDGMDAGKLRPELALPLLQAYAHVRPFTDNDQQAWPMMLRAAALRFWMSRLYDVHLPREAHELTPHDPTHFERILRLRCSGVLPLPL